MTPNNEQFDAAVFIVQNLPKEGPVTTSNEEKLSFYGLFKQATNGKCNTTKPMFYDIQGVYKWNAWNKLENMDKEEAMVEYVRLIQRKIRKVQEEYKTEEWMKGDTYDILAPKMEILGILQKKEKEEEVKVEEERNEEGERVEVEATSTSSISAISDNEYADAIDDEEQSRSSSFTDGKNRRKLSSSTNSLKNSCTRLEKELKLITQQIEHLGKAVEQRHNTLVNLMKKATIYVLVPRSLPYRTLIFFVFWPFVANFLLRWLKRFLIYLYY